MNFFMEKVIASRGVTEDQSSPAGQESANIDAVRQAPEDVSSGSLSVLGEQSVELHFFVCTQVI